MELTSRRPPRRHRRMRRRSRMGLHSSHFPIPQQRRPGGDHGIDYGLDAGPTVKDCGTKLNAVVSKDKDAAHVVESQPKAAADKVGNKAKITRSQGSEAGRCRAGKQRGLARYETPQHSPMSAGAFHV
jgi:hypothetical protein